VPQGRKDVPPLRGWGFSDFFVPGLAPWAKVRRASGALGRGGKPALCLEMERGHPRTHTQRRRVGHPVKTGPHRMRSLLGGQAGWQIYLRFGWFRAGEMTELERRLEKTRTLEHRKGAAPNWAKSGRSKLRPYKAWGYCLS